MPRAHVGKPRSRLEAALVAAGISVNELAAALGGQYAHVWRVAAGQSAMTRARAQRYAAALADLGVEVAWHEII